MHSFGDPSRNLPSQTINLNLPCVWFAAARCLEEPEKNSTFLGHKDGVARGAQALAVLWSKNGCALAVSICDASGRSQKRTLGGHETGASFLILIAGILGILDLVC